MQFPANVDYAAILEQKLKAEQFKAPTGSSP
jgi:hypothetical protein